MLRLRKGRLLASVTFASLPLSLALQSKSAEVSRNFRDWNCSPEMMRSPKLPSSAMISRSGKARERREGKTFWEILIRPREMRDRGARSALDLSRVCLSNINASRALFARDPLLAYFSNAMDKYGVPVY